VDQQVQQGGGKTIVYGRVAIVDQLAIKLDFASYHAHSEDREGTLTRFISGELSIIIASGTNIDDMSMRAIPTPKSLLRSND